MAPCSLSGQLGAGFTGQQTPATGQQTPATGQQTPATGQQTPATGHQALKFLTI